MEAAASFTCRLCGGAELCQPDCSLHQPSKSLHDLATSCWTAGNSDFAMATPQGPTRLPQTRTVSKVCTMFTSCVTGTVTSKTAAPKVGRPSLVFSWYGNLCKRFHHKTQALEEQEYKLQCSITKLLMQDAAIRQDMESTRAAIHLDRCKLVQEVGQLQCQVDSLHAKLAALAACREQLLSDGQQRLQHNNSAVISCLDEADTIGTCHEVHSYTDSVYSEYSSLEPEQSVGISCTPRTTLDDACNSTILSVPPDETAFSSTQSDVAELGSRICSFGSLTAWQEDTIADIDARCDVVLDTVSTNQGQSGDKGAGQGKGRHLVRLTSKVAIWYKQALLPLSSVGQLNPTSSSSGGGKGVPSGCDGVSDTVYKIGSRRSSRRSSLFDWGSVVSSLRGSSTC